jgi:hypothetical protein
MIKTNMDLSELLAKHDQGDFLRTIAEAVVPLIMEADVEGLMVESFAQIDKEEIDPILSITTKAA